MRSECEAGETFRGALTCAVTEGAHGGGNDDLQDTLLPARFPMKSQLSTARGSRHMLHSGGASGRALCSEMTSKPWRR
jgi:hypothetical protein